MHVRRLTRAQVANKRVLVRVGYDVPVDRRGRIADTFRIDRTLPTIRFLQRAGSRVILLAHRGKPKGRQVASLSLRPVRNELTRALRRNIRLVSLPDAPRAAKALGRGDVLLVENLRFHPGEQKASPLFAKQLAALGDVFVNDDFSTTHRKHASVTLLARLLPSFAGLNLWEEMTTLGQLHSHPRRPFYVLIGGGKVADKLSVVRHLLPHVDGVLLGGAPASTVLRAQGCSVGRSLVDQTLRDRDILRLARSRKLLMPTDVVVARSPKARRGRVAVCGEIGERDAIFDLGPKTLAAYRHLLSRAKTVFWAGPVGLTENAAFVYGTRLLARSIPRRGALTIAGGGDTVRALHDAGLASRFSFLSTGGSALLKFMAGERLPAIEALKR